MLNVCAAAEEEADKIGKADKKVDSVVMTDSGTDVLVKQEKGRPIPVMISPCSMSFMQKIVSVAFELFFSFGH